MDGKQILESYLKRNRMGVGKTTQEAVKDLFDMAEDARAEFTADLNNGVLGEHLKCELDILNELLGEQHERARTQRND